MRSLLTIRLLAKYVVVALVALIASACTGSQLSEELERAVAPDESLQEDSIISEPENTCRAFATEDWPESFPSSLCYPQATLIDARVLNEDDLSQYWDKHLNVIDGVNQGLKGQQQRFQAFWKTSTSIEEVRQFYQNFFEAAGWDMLVDPEDDNLSLTGVKDNLQVVVDFDVRADAIGLPGADETTDETNTTDLSDLFQINRSDTAEQIQYALLYSTYPNSIEENDDIAADDELPVQTDLNSDDSDSENGNSDNDRLSRLENATVDDAQLTERNSSSAVERTQAGNTDTLDSNPTNSGVNPRINDVSEAPEVLRTYVKEFGALRIVPLTLGDDQQTGRFRPNDEITRREYARWLFLANNLFYGDRPSQTLRKSDQNASPIFQDIPPSDPDFGIIQGLAESGLISSTLFDESASLLFRPDEPLTREDLITWKTPLDSQNAPPPTIVENIEQSWGFRDAAQINPSSLSAIWLDSQNGDASNIRRAFGFTRLFQPAKTVTRAEAAAVLWYFGTQEEGRSAKTVLEDINTGSTNN